MNMKSLIYRQVAFLIRAGVRCASMHPGFKHLILLVLNRMPSLKIWLRRKYIQFSFSPNSYQSGWAVSEAHNVASTDANVLNGSAKLLPNPRRKGVNATQRTPLEANFHIYGGRQ